MNVEKESLLRTVAALAILPATLLGVSACASSEEDDLPVLVEESTEAGAEAPEEGSGAVDSYEDYTGVYDREFFDDVEFYVGAEVTLAAIVDEVLSPNVFTIVSSTNATNRPEQDVVDVDEVIIEPLLIVHQKELPGLTPGTPVGVTGIVHEEFYPATVEQELDLAMDAAVFGEWEEQAYVEATNAASLTTD